MKTDPDLIKTNHFSPVDKGIMIVITGLFLLSYGPVKYYSTNTSFDWFYVLFCGCVIVLLFYLIFNREDLENHSLTYVHLCLWYAGIIGAVGLIHWAQLSLMNDFNVVNVVGKNVFAEKKDILSFVRLYLFFPLSLVLHIFLLRNIDPPKLVPPLAFFMLSNIGIIYYQRFFNTRFINDWQPATQQVCGLFGDPNQFSLSFFLLIILVIVSCFCARNLYYKFFLWVLILLSIGGLLFAGGRTAVAGLILLGILWPVVLMLSNTHWSPKKRVLVAFSPIFLALLIITILPFLMPSLQQFGIAGRRVAETYYKISQNGLGSLFSGGEMRGHLFSVGYFLLQKSPLGGWGPGGFNTEYPNAVHILFAKNEPAFDMVLNHYLMIAVDFGLPFLLLNLLLIFIPITAAIYYLRREKEYLQRLMVAILFVGNLIFLLMIFVMPPSFAPPVIWLWTGQLAYFVVLAEKKGFLDLNMFKKKSFLVFLGLISVTTILGSFQTSFGSKGYSARYASSWWDGPQMNYNSGCYGLEYFAGDTSGRWCRQNSFVQIPLPKLHVASTINIRIENQYQDVREKHVTLEYGGKSGPRQKVILKKEGFIELTIPLDEEHLYQYRLQDGTEKRYVVLSLNPSRTWVPVKYGIGEDSRELGVKVIFFPR